MSPLVWLVTGCSPGGLGEQFVHGIVSRGDLVIVTARTLQKAKSLKQPGVALLQLDLTDSQQIINETISKAIGIYGKIDVLVNNAGYIAIGNWEDLEFEDFLAQFDTNVFGTLKATRAILPHLRERRAGTIIFISSLSGWIGHPGVGAYAGSKFALEGMTESLRNETSAFGIKTLLIEPGRFRNNSLSEGNLKSAVSEIPDYAGASQELFSHLREEDQKQAGDPIKPVEIILDLVRQEGVSQGRDAPFRLPYTVLRRSRRSVWKHCRSSRSGSRSSKVRIMCKTGVVEVLTWYQSCQI